MDIATTFGHVLRQLRKDAGLTQEQLGFEAELERNYISMLELGQRQPTLVTIFKLSSPLKTVPSQIVALVEAAIPDDTPDKKTRK
ncbi:MULTISPECIES: helix-turn-helix transcriptional regulator [unclassified Brenneria]|uniref:helix-turn-helix domain-containing protein n=1 Tax=unclassified Brenneria TaxID=2634434 RepID=UPI0029C48B07|nr:MULTISPECIES: helix-turn-helix transcriptional regulator [unclassified Brenneria]MDX5627310.1 helix-turn-helix transcriptional regulator [Brenneria sp. L3-3Z]MDX5694534.1 helix-turn-helix transcriptional regulator [Brenneria sp. L4-2C]